MHHDIKAENIMFVDINYNRIKLIDFGSAKRIEEYDGNANYYRTNFKCDTNICRTRDSQNSQT